MVQWDLNMGYYTIQLDPDTQKLCTIVTPFGKYQYLQLPMGVSCSPDIFQHKMLELMSTLTFVKTYLDDLLIVSTSTFEDHLYKLERVLFAMMPLNIWDIGLLAKVSILCPPK